MKKIIFLFVLIINFYILSHDKDIARYYLINANQALNNGDINLSKDLLDKAYDYYSFYPEYYYLMNQLIESKKDNLFNKSRNAQKILQYIDNQFLINKYIMLKDAFNIFKKTLDYKNLSFTFFKILELEAIDILEESLIFMEYSVIFEDYKNFERVLTYVRSNYKSLDIDFYFLLLSSYKKDLNPEEFKKRVDTLKANNYSLSKLLYIKTIFYNDINNIKKIFLEYKNLKDNLKLETIYKKDIIFNLLTKYSFLTRKEQIELINDWIEEKGLNDIRTDFLLNKTNIYNLIIKSIKEINEKFIFFDGIRIRDIDRDNNWEEFYEYKNGILLKKIVDNNQDGFYDYKMEYLNGEIKSYYQYSYGSNDHYKKYNFNINDNSLSSIEYYSFSLIKRINLITSFLKPDLDIFKGLEDNEIIRYIDNIEYFGNENIIERYKNGVLFVRLIDSDKNNFFEIREEYNNGIKTKSYKDLNENGFFEVIEIYLNGILNTLLYSSEEKNNIYDYKEVLQGENWVKYWDNNHDGIYEVSVEEKGKTILTKFDIDFNGMYDIIYEEKENIINIYRNYNEGIKLINSYYKDSQKKFKYKGWIIVSVRNLEKIELPDEIKIKDRDKLNGFFYYKNKKYYFENGIIKNEIINFKIFIFQEKFYLIDQIGVVNEL